MVERNVKGKYNLCDVNSVFNRRYQEKKNRCPAIVGISGDRNTISGNHKVRKFVEAHSWECVCSESPK